LERGRLNQRLKFLPGTFLRREGLPEVVNPLTASLVLGVLGGALLVLVLFASAPVFIGARCLSRLFPGGEILGRNGVVILDGTDEESGGVAGHTRVLTGPQPVKHVELRLDLLWWMGADQFRGAGQCYTALDQGRDQIV
jgi:hypothetical protein